MVSQINWDEILPKKPPTLSFLASSL